MHGHDLTPEDRRLLRSRPPDDALRWCAREAGGEVVRVEALEGGTSSAVHGIDVAGRDGALRRLVLRRYVREDWLEEEPDIAAREAAALDAVAGLRLPTPTLVAVAADRPVPMLLMSRLDGVIRWRELDLARLATALRELHEADLPTDGLPPYTVWPTEIDGPPSWAVRPEVWERALAVFERPAPGGDRLIHRDFHPGNVLWSGAEVSGLIDWPNASVGSALADVGYCRHNLAQALGPDAADAFLELYGVEDYDPYWDVQAALGGFDEWYLRRDWSRVEEFLSRALSPG